MSTPVKLFNTMVVALTIVASIIFVLTIIWLLLFAGMVSSGMDRIILYLLLINTIIVQIKTKHWVREYFE